MQQPPSGNRPTGQVEQSEVACCIAGCGPAGAMLGLLLARAGVEVLVLEKHADFLRDFRGDTLHPSTLNLFEEFGLAEDLLRLPHQRAPVLGVSTDAGDFTLADFRRLLGRHRYVAFMPQWDFLDFVVGQARRLPTFRLRLRAEALGVLEEAGRVVGLTYRDQDGTVRQVRARLTVAADGRDSRLRRSAGLRPRVFGAPMDVLWFRLSRRPDDRLPTFGRLAAGHLMVLIDRGADWQVAYVIHKGAMEELHRVGLARFRATVAKLVPFLADRVEELGGWDDVRVLRVQVDRLRRWFRPGFVCIGDAAHAMSPSAGSASTWRCTTPWPRQTCSPGRCGTRPCPPGPGPAPAAPHPAHRGRPADAARRPGPLPVAAAGRPRARRAPAGAAAAAPLPEVAGGPRPPDWHRRPARARPDPRRGAVRGSHASVLKLAMVNTSGAFDIPHA